MASELRLTALQVSIEAIGLRVVLPIVLRVLPLDGALRALTPRVGRTAPDVGVLSTIERVTDLVTREIPGVQTACLKRALMRYVLLRRHGHAASFVIGVRPGGRDGFEAHAWVTLDGTPIMERETNDYRRTFTWPPEE